MAKFLVLWRLDPARLTREVVTAVQEMPNYAKKLQDQGKVVARYHVVGRHGGAWIYDAASNEELSDFSRWPPSTTSASTRCGRWRRWRRPKRF